MAERASERVTLRGRAFAGAVLVGAELSGARFERCSFARANLHSARLEDVELRECDLADADLAEARLTDARLSDCRLDGADASGALMSGIKLMGGSWRYGRAIYAHFGKADIHETDLRWMDLTAARCPGLVVYGATLAFARLASAQLDRAARFHRVDLRGANLDKAVLGKTTFVDRGLHGVVGTPIVGDEVSLNGTDLSADFDGTDKVDGKEVVARWRPAPTAARHPFGPPYVVLRVAPETVDAASQHAAIARAFPGDEILLGARSTAVLEPADVFFSDHDLYDVIYAMGGEHRVF